MTLKSAIMYASVLGLLSCSSNIPKTAQYNQTVQEKDLMTVTVCLPKGVQRKIWFNPKDPKHSMFQDSDLNSCSIPTIAEVFEDWPNELVLSMASDSKTFKSITKSDVRETEKVSDLGSLVEANPFGCLISKVETSSVERAHYGVKSGSKKFKIKASTAPCPSGVIPYGFTSLISRDVEIEKLPYRELKEVTTKGAKVTINLMYSKIGMEKSFVLRDGDRNVCKKTGYATPKQVKSGSDVTLYETGDVQSTYFDCDTEKSVESPYDLKNQIDRGHIPAARSESR